MTYLDVEEARQLYEMGDAAHDFDHVLRVTRMAKQIALAETADITVVRLAALLHDVPVPASTQASHEFERMSHHLAAAQFAKNLLERRGLGTGRLTNVVHSIEAHRFREQSVQPQTIEAKCLYDADKLDSIGAMGVARAFAYAGVHGNRLWTQAWPDILGDDRRACGEEYSPVHEYVYKLRHLVTTFHTETARRIGHERHEFMRRFFDQLDVEMQAWE